MKHIKMTVHGYLKNDLLIQKTRVAFLPWSLSIRYCPNQSICSSKLDFDSDVAFVSNLLQHLFRSVGFFRLDPEQLSHQLSLDALQIDAASSTQCPPIRPCLLPQPLACRARQQCLWVWSGAWAPGPGEVCIALHQQEFTRREMRLLWSRSSLTAPAGNTSLHKVWSSFSPELYCDKSSSCSQMNQWPRILQTLAQFPLY